jgi:uncharacterized membrane protein
MTSPSTSTGLQENIAALLCYVLGWVSGVVFLILEPKNKTIKFHAIQSIIVFGALSIINFIFGWIPVLGIIIGVITGVLAFVLWIVLMVRAYQGSKYKVPVAGDLAEKYSAQ